MDNPLISTKYRVPPVGVQLIERPRLLRKLNNGLSQEKRLFLVCAPAGYGKTTLIAEWVNWLVNRTIIESKPQNRDQASIHIAWLTCDKQDNDLAHFLPYLISGLQQGNLQIDRRLLENLHAAKPPSPETLATLLINELAENNHPFVLVLDDLHCISSQSVHQFLNFLLEHHPPKLFMVLVTRSDPPLALAKYRARGQMIEIRQDDLSFTNEESTEFFNQTLQVALNESQLSILVRRTEGWPAGLQLAGLSLNGTSDISTMIETFSGDHEYITDYLTDEVLAQQPEDIQSFLMQTSILERISGPLCAAVTGNANAGEILEKLREKNLFLVPMDQEKTWYRFHTLFADLLQNRLHRMPEIKTGELHLRASRWYGENGLITLAIKHAFTGQDFEYAANLVKQALEPAFINGQVINLLNWLEALPDDTKNRHPVLWVYQGLSYIWCGKPMAGLKSELSTLMPLFQANGLLGEACMLQGLYAMTNGNSSQAALLSESALQQLPETRTFFRCLAADTLGMTRIMQCDAPAAIQAFNQIIDMSAQVGYVIFEILARSHLAGLRLQQGRLHAAAIEYQYALDLTIAKIGRDSPVTGNVLLGLGELAREWGDLKGAMRYFSESVKMFAQFSDLGIPIADLSMARVMASQRDYDKGEEYLAKARIFAQTSRTTHFIEQLVNELQANFWIKRGQLGLAEQWALERGLFEHPISEVIEKSGPVVAGSEFFQNDYLTIARLYIAQNKPDAALQILDQLLNIANSLGYVRRILYILVAKSIALLKKKETVLAEEVLNHALSLAEPEEYLQVFLDEREQLIQLTHQVVAHGNESAFVKKLLAAFKLQDSEPDGNQKKVPLDGMVPQLSDREHQVLNLLGAGLSNKDICLQLHLSLSTVKGHTTNIYSKLGVNSRTQAIAEANRLGLLTT